MARLGVTLSSPMVTSRARRNEHFASASNGLRGCSVPDFAAGNPRSCGMCRMLIPRRNCSEPPSVRAIFADSFLLIAAVLRPALKLTILELIDLSFELNTALLNVVCMGTAQVQNYVVPTNLCVQDNGVR